MKLKNLNFSEIRNFDRTPDAGKTIEPIIPQKSNPLSGLNYSETLALHEQKKPAVFKLTSIETPAKTGDHFVFFRDEIALRKQAKQQAEQRLIQQIKTTEEPICSTSIGHRICAL